MSQGSEDAYYEMDIQSLEETIEYWDYRPVMTKRKLKQKQHRRDYKQREKDRIEHLSKISWMNVINMGDWKKRCYRGKVSKYLKKRSNKTIRQYKGNLGVKGFMCHKVYDYWWELY